MAESLPSDIPTVQEIAASKDIIFQLGRRPRKIVRVRDYAVKVQAFQEPFENESENLRFLSQYPGLKVPKIYAAFEDNSIWPFNNCSRERWPGLSVYYMVLDFIPGDTLENRAESLSREQHLTVQRKLRELFDILRSAKPPQPYYGQHGKHGNRRFPMCEIASCEFNEQSLDEPGPYTDDESFRYDVASTVLLLDHRVDEAKKYQVEYALKVFRESDLFRGFSPTLTHADLQSKNIMITLVGNEKEGVKYDVEGDEDIIVTLIDWESMIWAPEWYEYCKIVNINAWPPWFNDLMTEALGPWYAQLPWWKILRSVLHL